MTLEDLSREALKAKFWSRVDIPLGKAWRKGCWEWRGALTTDRPQGKRAGWGGGYGCLKIEGMWWRAHLYAWWLLHGKVPEGMVLSHSCDNRKCVNPRHLSPKTKGENLKEAHDRGRVTGRQKGAPAPTPPDDPVPF